jgi:hypothetical protein
MTIFRVFKRTEYWFFFYKKERLPCGDDIADRASRNCETGHSESRAVDFH